MTHHIVSSVSSLETAPAEGVDLDVAQSVRVLQLAELGCHDALVVADALQVPVRHILRVPGIGYHCQRARVLAPVDRQQERRFVLPYTRADLRLD